jgi:hypothetical protein
MSIEELNELYDELLETSSKIETYLGEVKEAKKYVYRELDKAIGIKYDFKGELV